MNTQVARKQNAISGLSLAIAQSVVIVI